MPQLQGGLSGASPSYFRKSPHYASHHSPSDCSQDRHATGRSLRSAQLLSEFISVKEAECSDKEDERRIRAAIQGQENDINELINALAKRGTSPQKPSHADGRPPLPRA